MSLFSIAFFIISSFLQTTDGQLTIILLDDQQRAAANESISFMTETDDLLASCVTDLNGRCTMNVSAPDASSGLIRGTLIISERGKRAVIWPGGPLTVQLMLDENGQLPQIVDVLATRVRTATPEPERTVEAGATATKTSTSTAETAVKASETDSGSQTGQALQPIATATTVLEEGDSVTGHNWWSFGLIIILFAALLLYIWSTIRRRKL